MNRKEYMKISEYSTSYGGEWGGKFKSIFDPMHHQWTFGKTWKDYKSEYISRGNKLGYQFE